MISAAAMAMGMSLGSMLSTTASSIATSNTILNNTDASRRRRNITRESVIPSVVDYTSGKKNCNCKESQPTILDIIDTSSNTLMQIAVPPSGTTTSWVQSGIARELITPSAAAYASGKKNCNCNEKPLADSPVEHSARFTQVGNFLYRHSLPSPLNQVCVLDLSRNDYDLINYDSPYFPPKLRAPKPNTWYEIGVYPDDYDFLAHNMTVLELKPIGIYVYEIPQNWHWRKNDTSDPDIKSVSG